MKTAVVLLNLGGASSFQSVQPYLYNIFTDPAIIKLSSPWRQLFAWGFSHLRTKKTQKIYQALGGKSTLLANTELQATSLENILGENYKIFISMRYWHPRTEEVIFRIKQYQPEQIILLPLYPQYSTTTTRSSLQEFEKFRIKEMSHIPCGVIESFPTEEGYVQALADLITTTVQNIMNPYRMLFSAHGVPLKLIQKGDPYQTHVEATVKKIISILNLPQLDYQICYQSRVGFLPWLAPYTIDEIKKAGQQKKSIVLVPVSFVSENSETLYELDIQYKELAQKLGVPGYYRVPTVSVHPLFIKALADLVKKVKHCNNTRLAHD